MGDEDPQSRVLLRDLALEGRALGLAAGHSHLLFRPYVSPAQLLLAVTQLSKSLPGGLEGSSWVFPLYSVPFETLQSNTGLGKAVFFPPLVCLRGHLVGNWHISDFVLMQTRSLNAVHQH